MRPFAYVSPSTVADALRSARHQRSAFIAGGTTLIDLMKLDVATPDQLIDLNGLSAHDPSLATITTLADGTLRIGALVPNSDLAWSSVVADRYPILSEALLAGASGQIRNMATVGGNLMQRTRCYYFRDTAMPCNKREPGSGCSAIHGHNRMHAVLGTSPHCIATSPGDMPVALVALDAIVRLRGPAGERTVPLTEFHVVPGDQPERDSVLRHGELIMAVDIPALPWARRSHYRKVRDRASYAFALASAGVALDIDGGTIRHARVALGGVGTKPWRSREAERALVGHAASPTVFRAAADRALQGAVGYRDNAFKIELATRTLVRALTTVSAMG